MPASDVRPVYTVLQEGRTVMTFFVRHKGDRTFTRCILFCCARATAAEEPLVSHLPLIHIVGKRDRPPVSNPDALLRSTVVLQDA